MSNSSNWKNYDNYQKQSAMTRDYYRAVNHTVAMAIEERMASHGRRGLDIACGHGDSTRVLSRFVDQVVGVDSSPELIQAAVAPDLGEKFDFVHSRFEDFEADPSASNQIGAFDLIGATWYLNHLHTEAELETAFTKIADLLRPGGVVALVVPSASYTSDEMQEIARCDYGWSQAWTDRQLTHTSGLFCYGGQWIETTIWQPLRLMRMLDQWFDVRSFDVKGLLVREGLLPTMHTEPPFDVITGQLRQKGRNQVMNDFQRSVTYSYAAGSTSLDPYGYRRIESGEPSRLPQLVAEFPSLRGWIHSQSLIISAYPASLGLAGTAPFVDTYLHPPAFVRACRLAQREQRSVVLASQPLVGADLMLSLCSSDWDLPTRILWVVGGYPLPRSLEGFVHRQLAERDCELKVLQCYGVAEVGHTCFAAIDRFQDGSPRYRQIAPHVTAQVETPDQRLRLTNSVGRTVLTEDHAERIDGHWRLTNGPARVDPGVWSRLESWTDRDWVRRTGYLYAGVHSGTEMIRCQLRQQVESPHGPVEVNCFDFWRDYGGSWTCKPVWRVQS